MKITTFILCAISSISVISAMPVFSQPSRNNIEEAEILLRRAINEYNNQNYAYYAAQYYLDQSIKLNPNNADAYFLRGNINRFAGNRPNAFDDYSKAIKLNPNYAMAYYNRGIIRIGIYHDGPIILDLLKALQILPTDAKKYNSMGLARVQLDDSQEVIQRLENIETRNPPSGVDFVYRGVARYRLGDRQAGIEDIKKGAEIFRRQGDAELQTKILDMVRGLNNSQPATSKPETSVRPSNANPPQPPLRLNNQKLEPESPKILLSANISSSEAQVLEKLNSVPVFTITDATGKPLFGKNDTNSPQVLFFFLNPDDATAYLNWIKNTNPELSQNARIIARSLTEAYQTIKKNQDRKDITFQITPSKSSLDSAREILPSQAKFANKLPNIPVFFATGNANGTNGLLTLTIDGKQTVPYFFDLKDLQSLLNKAMQAQPNVSNSTKIQVTSLYYVLDLMVDAKNGKPNPETERFEFVPSRSAFEYAVQKGSSK